MEFTAGIKRPEPTPVIRAMQRAMDALSRANVVLYGVDPRGLYSQETEWLEYNPNDKTAAPPPDPQELARSIQSLRTVSDRTGGFALVNTNDFGDDFKRIVAESSQYYVLGYSPTNRSAPGEYRRISVRVRPGLRVSAREGYVVPPPRAVTTPVRPELAALDDALPVPGLGLSVQAIPVAADGLARVQVIVEIDGNALGFREEAGKFTERVNLAMKTVDDRAQESNRTAWDMTVPPLTPRQRDRVARAGLRWLATIDVPPGHHSLRVAAHALTSGLTGSVFVDLDVPSATAARAALSDIALTATSAAETVTAGAPSIFAPLPGPPTTRWQFRVGEIISVAVAVQPGATSQPRATATVSRLGAAADAVIVNQPVPLVTEDGQAPLLVFGVPAAQLGPGDFVVAIRVMFGNDGDPQERRVSFTIAP
jgi:hypothetical protein